MAKNRVIRGIRDKIPGGFVIGRVGKGVGKPTLIPIGRGGVQAGAGVPGGGGGGGGASIQTLLNTISVTKGAILYRDTTLWSALTPGTAGFALLSGGVGVNPSYGAVIRPGVTSNYTVGYTATAYDAGTFITGTWTPNPQLGNLQRVVNNGAFEIAEPSTLGDYTIAIKLVNGASAGAITETGFDIRSGDSFTTTNAAVFMLYLTKINGISHLSVVSTTPTALIPLSYLDTDGTLAANSDSRIATQKATKTYVDTLGGNDFLVKTASASMSAERVVTDTTSIITDWGTAGQAKIQRAALTGDITAPLNSNATTLATVNANVGTFGSATQVGQFTVNGKGIITAAANVGIAIPSTAVTDFTEAAQDAIGAMIDASLNYVDATPLLQRSALTGDVTAAAGSNALTIANDAVTYAKMQNISATQRVLGRNTAGAGDTEEVTASQVLDWRGTTRGSILYRGASTWDPLVPSATVNQPLVSKGTGADPAYSDTILLGSGLVGTPSIGVGATDTGLFKASTYLGAAFGGAEIIRIGALGLSIGPQDATANFPVISWKAAGNSLWANYSTGVTGFAGRGYNSAAASVAPTYGASRGRGSLTAPSVPLLGDYIVKLGGNLYTSGTPPTETADNGGEIAMIVTETGGVAASRLGTKWTFSNCPIGSSTVTEVFSSAPETGIKVALIGVNVPAGLVGTPSIQVGATNTGFYLASSELRVSVGGVIGPRFTADGMGIGAAPTSTNTLIVIGGGQIGGTASSTRAMNWDSNGVCTFKNANNAATIPIILQNTGITAANQGLRMSWRLGPSAVGGVDAGRMSVISTEDWSTGANESAAMLFDVALDGVLTETLRLNPATGLNMFGTNIVVDQNRIIRPRSYTVATLPTITTTGLIYVSDAAAIAVLAYSDGTDWRRVDDHQIVSATVKYFDGAVNRQPSSDRDITTNFSLVVDEFMNIGAAVTLTIGANAVLRII